MNAVTYIDKEPFFELTASEIIYPFEFKGVDINVHFKPYEADDLRTLLPAIGGKWKKTGRKKLEHEHADDIDVCKKFFDRYFIKLSAPTTKHSEDELAQWLHRKEWFKRDFVQQGFGGLVARDESVRGRMLSIDTPIKLYCPQRGSEVRIGIVHRFTKPNKVDTVNVKTWKRMGVTLCDIRQRLYDQKIKSLDGVLVEGASCEPSNNEVWKPLVPLWWKINLASRLFK